MDLFLLFVFLFAILLGLFCSLVVTWPLGSLVCDVFVCSVTFPYGVLG